MSADPCASQVRDKASGISGSATAPPNPRGLNLERFATPEQKLIAQYNIACCYARLGDTPRTMEILTEYVKQVRPIFAGPLAHSKSSNATAYACLVVVNV